MDWLNVMATAKALHLDESMITSLQDGSPRSPPPGIYILVFAPSTSYQVWYGRSIKDTEAAFWLCSLSRGRQLPCHKQSLLLRDKHEEKLRPLVNSYKEVKPANDHENELESRSYSLVKASDNCRYS